MPSAFDSMPSKEDKRVKAKEVVDILEEISILLVRYRKELRSVD